LKKPHSSSRDVSKALFAQKTTILRVFTGLGLRFYKTRWSPHKLSEEQNVDRVTVAQDMLQVMQDLGPKQRKYLITGGKTWIFLDNNHRGMWAEDREGVPPNVKRMVCSKKTMLSAYFLRTSFVSIEFLPQGQKYNSHFFTEIILPSVVENLSVARSKLKATADYLHVDNTKPHNCRLSLQNIEEYGFIRVPQPPYSPDLAPCDFLFVI
jgi:histone-lysine N-methyltransferase SETMAR